MKRFFLALLMLIALSLNAQTRPRVESIKFNTPVLQTDSSGDYNLIPLMRSSGYMNGSYIPFDDIALKSNVVTLDGFQTITDLKLFDGGLDLWDGNITGRKSTISLGIQKSQSTGNEAFFASTGLVFYDVTRDRKTALTASGINFNDKLQIGIGGVDIDNTLDDIDIVFPQKSGTVALLEDTGVSIYDSDGVLQGTTSDLHLSEDLEYNDATNTISVKDELVSLESSLVNGWVNFGSTWEQVSYTKKGNTVTVYGMISSGTVSTVLILPVEIRPNRGVIRTFRHSDGSVYRLTLSSAGAISIEGITGEVWVNLEGITYNINN